jgi:hypothetical protein
MPEETMPSVPEYDREAEVSALWDADESTAGDIWRRLKEGKTQQQIAEEDGITIGPVYSAMNLHNALRLERCHRRRRSRGRSPAGSARG